MAAGSEMWVAVLWALLLACGPTDRDGDGATDVHDCDDDNAMVHPDADELCNGIDDDCDGEIDGAHAVDAVLWYLDADADGRGAGDPIQACAGRPGMVRAGTDCDDADAAVYPGAIDIPDDGRDQDCDGVDAPLTVPPPLARAVERLAGIGYRPMDWSGPRNPFRSANRSAGNREMHRLSREDGSAKRIVDAAFHRVSSDHKWRGWGLSSDRPRNIPIEIDEVAVWEVTLEADPMPGGWPRRLHLNTWMFADEAAAASAWPTLQQLSAWVVSTRGAKHPNRLWRDGAVVYLVRVNAAVLSAQLDAVHEALDGVGPPP